MPIALPDDTPTISVLIPARNEATNIGALLCNLRAQAPEGGLELIVCDGQSSDDTVAIARAHGARVLFGAPNRGAQQNAGARIAAGELLWFLHADAIPHRQSLRYLKRMAQYKAICGGNFRLAFDSENRAARAFEVIAGVQRRRGVYYGDSGIWVRRETFDLLNGFHEWPLFEDYDFARRMEYFASRHGQRTTRAPLALTASARRFQNAPLKVLAQWLRLQILFSLGASPENLAAQYFKNRLE